MGAASIRPRGHGARAVEEALGAVAAPGVASAILGVALARFGGAAVPESGENLAEFVRGPLRAAIVDRLGDDVAEEVVQMLAPLLTVMAARRSVRPVPAAQPNAQGLAVPRPLPSATSTQPPPAGAHDPWAEDDDSGVIVVRESIRAGAYLPVIVAVSANAERMRALALEVVGRAVVRTVEEVFELAEVIEDHRDDSPIVLFDCESPPFHLETMAAFLGDLPASAAVALLAPRAEDERMLRVATSDRFVIVRLRSGESIATVAARCLSLVV
jgi:hypothetical protein